MSNQSPLRLWGLVSLVIILIFFFMFMSSTPSDQSRNSDYWEDEIEIEDNTPQEIGIAHILLIVVTGVAFLATFHPSYGGWNFKSRFFYQGFLLILVGTIGMTLTQPQGSGRDLAVLFLVLIPFIWFPYGLGVFILLGQKRYALVHRILDVGQRFTPKNANLYITRASAYGMQSNYEKALEAVNRAIELTPRFKKKEEGWFSFDDNRLISAHNIRMSLYFALAQQDMAMDDAEILVRINPTSPVHYINRSLAFRQRGEYEAAQADLDHASQLNPDPYQQAFLIYSRGHLATLQAQPTQARDFFNAALEVPLPEGQQKNFHPEVYKEIGLLEMREGHEVEAEAAFQKAQVINPEYAIIGIALLHAQRGEWDQAIAEWKRLITLEPNFRDFEIMRRHHKSNPPFVALIEQIFARLGNTSPSPAQISNLHTAS